ncbi:ETS domain-containing transcription factor ERF-like isoform X2 [Lates japonicus]|uniref:ETS domain-containing transcription factor ERF-like isoform X2 n=1 Tax=Lates japonicus TaxID=270547 RepID=A0AAD3NJC6_LATJO|nr:ETS domain-containing transcription factor ERF-like isoform X2 [Lates japonicus]
MANSPLFLAQNHFNGAPPHQTAPQRQWKGPYSPASSLARTPQRNILFDRGTAAPGLKEISLRLDTFPFLSSGAFSLNNCPKLPWPLYPPQFPYPNPCRAAFPQLPHPSPASQEAGGAQREQRATGGTNGTAGGQPARLCLPPLREPVNGSDGHWQRGLRWGKGKGWRPISVARAQSGAGAVGWEPTGQTKEPQWRGGVKQDPSRLRPGDTDLERLQLGEIQKRSTTWHQEGIQPTIPS